MTERPVFIAPREESVHFDRAKGKLYYFEEDCIKVFAPGEVRCWCKSAHHPKWKGHVPSLMANPYRYSTARWRRFRRQETSPGPAVRWQSRLRWGTWEWLQTFDREYARELRDVDPSMFWGALSMLYDGPEVREAFVSNPAWALLTYYGWNMLDVPKPPQQRLRAMRTWAKRRRRDVLGRLGLPADERGVRLLRKLELQELTVYHLHGFCNLWRRQSPWIETFQHMERILPLHLEVVSELARYGKGKPRLTTGCVCSALPGVVGESGMDLPTLLHDTCMMEDTLKRGDGGIAIPDSVRRRLERPRSFRTQEELLEWHDRISVFVIEIEEARWRRREIDLPQPIPLDKNASFPSAPLPDQPLETSVGTVELCAFENVGELLTHARQQGNCMAGFIDLALEGKIYLYAVKVEGLPLHSLSLWPQPGGLRKGQLVGPRNAPAQWQIQKAIQDWVGDAEFTAEPVGPLPFVMAVGDEGEDYPF